MDATENQLLRWLIKFHLYLNQHMKIELNQGKKKKKRKMLNVMYFRDYCP